MATAEQTTGNNCQTACATTWRGAVDAYDQYGERTGTTDGRGVAVDATGNATLADPNGLYTGHTTYDAQGDVASAGTPPITTTLNGITTTAPATTTYGYDGDGDQTSETSANGGVTSDAYDHLGRQVQVARPPVALYGASGAALASTIATAAGTGAAAYGGDDGPATAAAIRTPPGVALEAAGNLYIVDNGNNRVREVVAATGVITTVAGSGIGGYGGDGGAATAAMIKNPQGLALDGARNLYIADNGNNRVRRVAASGGVIATVAGNGLAGYGGDGGPATAATLNAPVGLALDAAGNLLIGDGANNRVRALVAISGTIGTVAGTGVAGYAGDGGPAAGAPVTATPEGP